MSTGSVVDVMNPQQMSLDSLVTYGYWAIFFFILLPLGGWIKRFFSKDPVLEEARKQTVILNEVLSQQTAILRQISNVEKEGMLGEAKCMKQFHTSTKFAFLLMISKYHERIRKNGLSSETRHNVLGRYQWCAEEVSGKFYVDLNGYTCKINGRTLSGFLNSQGGDMLFNRIAEQLFDNHWKISKKDPTALNEEDVELAMDRFVSIVLGSAKKWMGNDKKTLEKAWDKLEPKLVFSLEAEEIEFYGGDNGSENSN
jgi:hypothetical protein